MNRDTAVFTACGFVLGLVVGSFLIGPHLVKTPDAAAAAAPDAPASAAPSAAPAGAPSMAQMNAVREQLAVLKQNVEKNPRDFDSLAQLGNMYMDAAKFPQAIDYYERALAVREEPSLRTDLGICYKQAGQLDKSVDAFRKAAGESPDQWQALFNEAVVLGDMQRWDEARTIAGKLEQLRPDDPQVKQLASAIATHKS